MVRDDKRNKESFILEEFPAEIFFEQDSSGTTNDNFIKGVFLKVNSISKNGRFYSEKIVNDFINQINKGSNIITMWTNHYPVDETLATVGKVLEAWLDPATGWAWFKAQLASTSAGEDIRKLLKDKFIEGVSVRYYPIEVKEAQVQDKLYFNILKAELFGIDFVATRTGIPLAKVKSMSREELEEFENVFNGEEESEMSELEKTLNESSEEKILNTEKEKPIVEDKKEDLKTEAIPEKPIEEKKEELIEEKEKVAEEKKEEPKVEAAVVDSSSIVSAVSEWESKYNELKVNVDKFVATLAEGIKMAAISVFDSVKDKKIFSKINTELDAVVLEDSIEIDSNIAKYKESINSVVEAYKELLGELDSKVFANTEAKDKLMDKSTEAIKKPLAKETSIGEEVKMILGEYGFTIADEDVKFMESN